MCVRLIFPLVIQQFSFLSRDDTCLTSDAQEGLIYLPCVLNVDDNRASGISCNIPLGFGKTKCVQEIQGELSMTINVVPKN